MEKTMKTAMAAIIAAVFTGCISIDGKICPTPAYELQEKFTGNEYVAENGVKMVFQAYTPDVMPNEKIPLIVYLHGAGQCGNDNKQQLDDGVGCLYSFSYGRDDYKAMIVAPQCPNGVYWRNDKMLEALKGFISMLSEVQFIDSSRIYITGFSMGGDASWKLALKWPTLMSTIIPVCGGPMASMEPDNPEVPDEMANVNIWAFNNFDDGIVRPRYAKRIFSYLWRINDGDTLNFTENVSGGHSAEEVYKNRDVLIWMMSTRKKCEDCTPSKSSSK